jgi:hypothetical protein
MSSNLARLRSVRGKLARAEKTASRLREERNALLYQVLRDGEATEREAAQEAGVTPAYAHRVKASHGRPPSGSQAAA